MIDEQSKDILGCGDISEDKANWLLEQAGNLIPEGTGQITFSQYEHFLSAKVHYVIQEVLQENRVGLKNKVIKTGLITMKGDLKVHSDNSGDAVLTEPIEQFKTGDVGFILGHAESWLTKTAQDIIEALRKQDLIIFSMVDKFQMNLSSHWGKDFRFVKNLSVFNFALLFVFVDL